ncbi:MAG TPA: hypothetical protein VKV80_20855 [Streptosporangiaceae bacterium]|jgi:hypothetical protein|nr:hypothetical protein [Streptosporangiaceae bacterium]
MKFGKVPRWQTRPSWLPEWLALAAPTVAVVAGTSLVGVLPAVIMTGTRHMLLVAVAAGVPFTLLLLMGVLLALLLPREAGPPGGGGWPPPPPDGPPDDPPWWPSFEEAFRKHAVARGRDLVGTRSAAGGHDGAHGVT